MALEAVENDNLPYSKEPEFTEEEMKAMEMADTVTNADQAASFLHDEGRYSCQMDDVEWCKCSRSTAMPSRVDYLL